MAMSKNIIGKEYEPKMRAAWNKLGDKYFVLSKHTLSSLYRLRTPDIYRSYLDDPAMKKKLAFKK